VTRPRTTTPRGRATAGDLLVGGARDRQPRGDPGAAQRLDERAQQDRQALARLRAAEEEQLDLVAARAVDGALPR